MQDKKSDPEDNCKTHHDILKLAFEKENIDNIWNAITFVRSECEYHIYTILHNFIENMFASNRSAEIKALNSSLPTYHNLLKFYASLDDKYYSYSNYVINIAIESHNYNLFELFIYYYIPKLKISYHEKVRVLIRAVEYRNDYALKRLEELKCLPVDYEILSNVIKGNLEAIENFDNLPFATLNSVFTMAIELRNHSLANANFIQCLISKFGINNRAFNFIEHFTSSVEDLYERNTEKIKFYISCGGSTNNPFIDILMGCASPKFLMNLISYKDSGENNLYSLCNYGENNMLKFLLDHGLKDLSKLKLNDENYLFLISCVFSLGTEIFYLPEEKFETRKAIIKGVELEKLSQACYYLKNIYGILNDNFTSVLSSLIMHYLFALNDITRRNIQNHL